jgi:hypothetical protein
VPGSGEGVPQIAGMNSRVLPVQRDRAGASTGARPPVGLRESEPAEASAPTQVQVCEDGPVGSLLSPLLGCVPIRAARVPAGLSRCIELQRRPLAPPAGVAPAAAGGAVRGGRVCPRHLRGADVLGLSAERPCMLLSVGVER